MIVLKRAQVAKDSEDPLDERARELLTVASHVGAPAARAADGLLKLRIGEQINMFDSVLVTDLARLELKTVVLTGATTKRLESVFRHACDSPRIPRFLLLLVPIKSREFVLGDMEEEFRTEVLPEYGPRWARFYFWWHALFHFASFLWSRVKSVAEVIFPWMRAW